MNVFLQIANKLGFQKKNSINTTQNTTETEWVWMEEDIYFRFFLVLPLVQTLPPLWPSGQSSWLQIRRPGLDSWHYQKKKVVGLERGPLSLVSTTEELLDRKVAASV
jgi:hypothetical protein